MAGTPVARPNEYLLGRADVNAPYRAIVTGTTACTSRAILAATAVYASPPRSVLRGSDAFTRSIGGSYGIYGITVVQVKIPFRPEHA